MSTMKNHLAEVHATLGENAMECCQAFKKIAAAHRAADQEDLADGHDELAEACASRARSHATWAKALTDGDGGTKKTVGTGTIAVEQIELQQLREALHKVSALLGDRIMPDRISGVVTNNPNVGITPIIRPGQQELVKRDGVPVEFENLIKVEA